LSALPGVENVRVLGTMLAMELVATDRGYLSGIGPALRAFALDRGVLLRPLGDTVYLLPPYCSTTADLERAYDVIAEFEEAR
jgi:Adenosylmethionine-8-amino-7-oxononanoate aminotransferase